MEALFSTQLASYEAWIMLLCILVFIGIYLFDGITFVRNVIDVFTPKPPILPAVAETSDAVVEVVSPMLEEITPEEIQAHEEEKETQIIEEEEQVTRLDEVEAKMIEEAETKIGDEDEVTAIEEVPQEPEATEKEITPEPEAIVEAPEVPVIPADAGIQPLSDTPIIEEVISREEINTIDETIETIGEEEKVAEAIEDPIEETEEEVIEETTVVPEILVIARHEAIQSLQDTIVPEVPVIPANAGIQPLLDTPVKKESNVEKLYLIVNEVKTLIARGQTLEARALIIQGLSLDKNHRELNLILGSLYEGDRQSQKAEYVYKDLAMIYPDDVEILEKLANILIIEKRYEIAMEIYKKIISLSGETEGSLYIMTHLAHELAHHEELYAYARRYQKNWPNNPEILALLAEAEVALGQRHDAIQTLIKLKNLTPYNSEIMDMIAKLTTEEELAGNFGG